MTEYYSTTEVIMFLSANDLKSMEKNSFFFHWHKCLTIPIYLVGWLLKFTCVNEIRLGLEEEDRNKYFLRRWTI